MMKPVAGFDRGVRPMGDWSIRMTLSMFSAPDIALWSPAFSRDRYSCRASARYRMSFTNVDLPEPETPVTTVITSEWKTHIDILEVIFLRAREC